MNPPPDKNTTKQGIKSGSLWGVELGSAVEWVEDYSSFLKTFPYFLTFKLCILITSIKIKSSG